MIKINNLTFGYLPNKNILHEFCAEFKRGERVCISAPSGAGKTTLLRLIAGLEKPDSGIIEKDEKLKIGIVFQEDVLLPWLTALENVAAVCDEETAKKWLTAFGLEADLNVRPSDMSGGMRRRTALARAVGYEADILLLDEPFKGLDKELKSKIVAALTAHFCDRLIIFTSHDEAETAEFATRKILLNPFLTPHS